MPSREQEKELLSPLTLKKGEKGAYSKNPTKIFDFVNFEKSKTDFHWIESDEPHTTRRREILRMHPEIKELFGVEPLTFWIVLFLVSSQIWIASWISQCSNIMFFLIIYIYGATVNHTLQLANHEISHNLVFESLNLNFLLGIFANIATGIPSSVTFRYYHMDHHQYQGVHITDTDIPTIWEVSIFKTKITKFFWVLGQAAAYGIRPLFTNPKPVTGVQIFNGICVITCDLIILYKYGFLCASLFIIKQCYWSWITSCCWTFYC
jgi:sphingolipid delta-4 desaturase